MDFIQRFILRAFEGCLWKRVHFRHRADQEQLLVSRLRSG
jgi:hypothetical protein